MFVTIGKVANELGMDVIGTTLEGSSNNSNAVLTGGTTVATVRLMTRDSFKDKYIKYSRRLHQRIQTRTFSGKRFHLRENNFELQ